MIKNDIENFQVKKKTKNDIDFFQVKKKTKNDIEFFQVQKMTKNDIEKFSVLAKFFESKKIVFSCLGGINS
jgi:hypothetical protein